ncbi:RNAse P Rpr2/Rpp21/SNM1 subunit domain-containing protein [Umbelopsis sp. PMI_123]|nr:RNAse P Rpr2/Rpp21/SNM1 subunit domain-containing protein [Umbelopsis sp. PMI_123]
MAASQAVQAKLSFLFKAANTQFASCPELSNFYLHQFQKTADHANVTLADAVQRLCCSRCGALFVAGVNCTVRLNHIDASKRRKTPSSKRCRNTVRTTCHACRHPTVVSGSTATTLNVLGRPSREKNLASSLTPPVATPLPDRPISKKNKKKKLGLQAMINQKKQPPPSQSSFGLDDFLSSL